MGDVFSCRDCRLGIAARMSASRGFSDHFVATSTPSTLPSLIDA
jgi:hypothetical protein